MSKYNNRCITCFGVGYKGVVFCVELDDGKGTAAELNCFDKAVFSTCDIIISFHDYYCMTIYLTVFNVI